MGQKNSPVRDGELAQFQHTQLGVSFAGAFGLCYVWCSSAQGIVDRYHFSKKWFYLYGVLVAFAYLYMRPFVRRGLGSAHRGYLNFYSLYILWLCSALFCHLPSLEALGIDIKADISVALSIAASSMLVLGVLHGLQVLLIHFKLLTPAPGATQQAIWSCILLNSITLSAACSTYFQLCGNGAAGPSSSSNSSQWSGMSAVLHDAVCVKYLAPIPTKEYPTFSAWMLYGEHNGSNAIANAAAAQAISKRNSCSPRSPSRSSGSWFSFGTNNSSSSSNSGSSSGSWFGFGSSSGACEPPSPAVAADGTGSLVDFVAGLPAGLVDDGGSVISPVFTMWITLVALYLINVLVDRVSAYDMSAQHISELRRERVNDPNISLLAKAAQAAGETFRQGAHQLVAAQQQRHQQQQQQQPQQDEEMLPEGDMDSKRSKSLEFPSSARQPPWSPRFMAERTLVNFLESTSSLSFAAAALLEGIETKGFPWQQLQNQARLGSLGLGGLSTLGDRLGSIRSTGGAAWGQGRRDRQQRQHSGDTSQLRRASTDGGEGVLWEQQQKQRRQRRQQQRTDSGLVEVDEVGGAAPRLKHTRSKSLSSIQSAGTASGREEEDGVTDHGSSQQQQQQQQPPVSRSRRGSVAHQQQQKSWQAAQHRQQQPPAVDNEGGHPELAARRSSKKRMSSSSRLAQGQSANTELQLDPRQQQQQRTTRPSNHSSGGGYCCTSPFAAASQPGAGFGARSYGGFGSAVSLYSHSSEGHEARALEQLLAAQVDGASADGRFGVLGYSSNSSGGGAAAPAAETGNSAATQEPRQSDAATAAAQQAQPGDAVVPESATPSAQGDSPMPLPQSVTASSPTEVSAWSDMTDECVLDLAECDGLSTPGSSYGGPSPPFLDMVPWYSGTSADLFKTMFDLMISVKLFLGRFDMRTMQAATAASMADSFNDTPSEGDGFTYEHYHDKEELWFDFIADTGDGGNSTYTVARALAAPSLTVPAADVIKRQQQQEQQQRQGLTTDIRAAQGQQSSSNLAAQQQLQLPRGEVLLIGGDLAYPNPSRDTYEQRLFVPFQEAMPPPPHYHPGRLCVHKPDLPPAFGLQESLSASRLGPSGLSPRTSRNASVAALRGYSGPNVFAIPGNHDWIDGLETFIKHIMHKGWLGGWLMPQEKSYFSLRLPDGWWVFGLDLALVGDIDMCQYRYFANVVERRLGPADNVIIITHEPIWLLEWFWASSSSSNLRQLVRGHLRGRARVHLAGDLHFYMRHSYTTKKQQQQQKGPLETAETDTQAAAAAASAPVEASATTAGVAAAEEKVAVADDLLQMPSVSPQDGLSSAVTWETPLQTPQGSEGTAPASQPGDDSDHRANDPIATDPVAAAAETLVNGGATACSVDLGIRSRRFSSSSSSSSSGVDSCTTPPGWQAQQQTAAAAAAGGLPLNSSNTSRSSSPGMALRTGTHSKSSNQSPSGPDTARCPIDRARQTLPRLVVGSPVSRNGSGDFGYGPSNSNSYGAYPQPSGTGHQAKSGNSPPVTWATPNHDSSKPHNRGATRKPHIQQHQEASLLDPEHLIVNGCGGAFLHPTHVFSYSRFACLDDEAAAATAAIYSSAEGGGFGDSYLTSVPISSGSSSSSSPRAAAGHSRPPLYSRPSVRQSSLAPWDHDMLSWHCPMSPSGMSDIWDQSSLHGMSQLNLGPAAVAAGRGISQQQHDPMPMLGSSSQPMSAAAATTTEQKPHTSHAAASPPPVAATEVVPPSNAVVGSGVYKCAAAFPSAEKSLRLGRKNLHLFRFKNSRFDVIGGAIYFLSIVSTLPRCNAGLALLSATSLVDFMTAFAAEFMGTWYDILMNSYLSLITVVMFFLLCFGFAKGGGVGAVSGERQNLHREQKRQRQLAQQQQQQDGHKSSGCGPVKGVRGLRGFKKAGRRSPVVGPLVKLRTGGGTTQLLVAVLHAGIHLSLGVVLLLVLELGVELCIKYERLGNAGLHSMYLWFEQYQDQHFPDPMGLRDMAHRWSLGLYPGVIKAAMAVYDIPEAIAVARNALCSAETVTAGFGSLSRVQLLAYYAGMLAYYWLLAIPAMGFVFGLYLYVCVCWFHVHYDEAFSALRIANFKGLTRLHVTKEGDLEIFSLGIDRVPTQWREDPRWYEEDGAGGGKVAAHAAAYPSRWVPAAAGKGSGSQDSPDDPSMGLRVVDYLKVPRQRPGLNAM